MFTAKIKMTGHATYMGVPEGTEATATAKVARKSKAERKKLVMALRKK